jgi:hypothetical protein
MWLGDRSRSGRLPPGRFDVQHGKPIRVEGPKQA